MHSRSHLCRHRLDRPGAQYRFNAQAGGDAPRSGVITDYRTNYRAVA
jgi:hypothetical protein